MKLRATSEKEKAVRKQCMLEAAIDVFYDKGFAAARMDDIANRCQLSKGTLYLYFDNKEALFNGLIETIAIPNLNHLVKMINQSDNAKEAIKSLVDFMPDMIRFSQMPRLMKIIIADSGAFPEVIKVYRKEVIDQVLQTLASTIKRSNDKGKTCIEYPDIFCRLVVAPVIFSAVWKAVFEHPNESNFDYVAFFNMHKKMLLSVMSGTKGVSDEDQ